MKFKSVVVYVLIAIAIVSIVLSIVRRGSDPAANDLAFSDVVQAARDGRVDSIDATGQSLSVRMKDDRKTYHSRISKDTDLTRILLDSGVTVGGASGVTVRYHDAGGTSWARKLVQFAPVLVFGAIILFRLRKSGARGNPTATGGGDSGQPDIRG